ncbi:MAG: T9SS type A sorting domain-containing protein [Bacteroidota bacterium]
MKRIIVLFTLCLVVFYSFSQNYRPFDSHATYTFEWIKNDHLDTELYILKTDSAYTSNQDTIYPFNRILRDTAILFETYGYLLKPDQDNIFGKAMIESPGGIYTFITSEEDSFRLEVGQPLNQSWMFNKKEGITASNTAKIEMDVAGIQDSVLQILLSSQDTILISKNYGLLKSSAFLPFILQNESYEYNLSLKGIEEKGIGFQLPTFQDLFDVQLGENFFKHAFITQYAPIGTYTWERSISPPLFPNPDSVVLTFERDRVELIFRDVFEYLGRDTITLRQSAQNFYPHVLSNQLNENLFMMRGPFLASGLGNKIFYVLENCSEIDETDPLYTLGYRFQNLKVKNGYGQGLANMYHKSFLETAQGVGDIYEVTKLGCYEKLTDTAGLCADTATYLNLDPVLEEAGLRAYPNPSHGPLKVEWDFLPAGMLDIELLDQRGRTIHSEKINSRLQNSLRLEVSGIPNGLYVLRFIWKGNEAGSIKISVQK